MSSSLVVADVDVWAERIAQAMNRTVEGIFATGAALAGAREALPYGDWERLFALNKDGLRMVPMGKRMANYFIQIYRAKARLSADGQNSARLPASWYTLAQLAALPEQILTNAMQAGLVRADMAGKDVARLKTAAKEERVAPAVDEHRGIDRSIATSVARLEEVTTLAARGASVPQIADYVGMSENGVRKLVSKHRIAVPASQAHGRTRRHDPNRIIEQMVFDAELLTADQKLIDWGGVIRSAKSRAWVESLRTSKRALDLFIKRLEREVGYVQRRDPQAAGKGAARANGQDARSQQLSA